MKKDIRIPLIGINVLLFVVLIIMLALVGKAPWRPPQPIAPALSQAVSTDFLEKFNLQASAYPQITQHPLFWPSRKPPLEKKEKKVEAAVPDPFTDVTLLGTFFDNDTGGVIIRLNKKKEVIRLIRGQTYMGWKLDDLSPISAVFSDAAHHQKTLLIEQAKQADHPVSAVKPQGQPSANKGKAAFDRWVPNEPPPKK